MCTQKCIVIHSIQETNAHMCECCAYWGVALLDITSLFFGQCDSRMCV